MPAALVKESARCAYGRAHPAGAGKWPKGLVSRAITMQFLCRRHAFHIDRLARLVYLWHGECGSIASLVGTGSPLSQGSMKRGE
jgi:hypothetical protein